MNQFNKRIANCPQINNLAIKLLPNTSIHIQQNKIQNSCINFKGHKHPFSILFNIQEIVTCLLVKVQTIKIAKY